MQLFRIDKLITVRRECDIRRTAWERDVLKRDCHYYLRVRSVNQNIIIIEI